MLLTAVAVSADAQVAKTEVPSLYQSIDQLVAWEAHHLSERCWYRRCCGGVGGDAGGSRGVFLSIVVCGVGVSVGGRLICVLMQILSIVLRSCLHRSFPFLFFLF